jgi:hypothetical protein
MSVQGLSAVLGWKDEAFEIHLSCSSYPSVRMLGIAHKCLTDFVQTLCLRPILKLVKQF